MKNDDYRTSISCKNSTKQMLRALEVHPRETDEDILLRILSTHRLSMPSEPYHKQKADTQLKKEVKA